LSKFNQQVPELFEQTAQMFYKRARLYLSSYRKQDMSASEEGTLRFKNPLPHIFDIKRLNR